MRVLEISAATSPRLGVNSLQNIAKRSTCSPSLNSCLHQEIVRRRLPIYNPNILRRATQCFVSVSTFSIFDAELRHIYACFEARAHAWRLPRHSSEGVGLPPPHFRPIYRQDSHRNGLKSPPTKKTFLKVPARVVALYDEISPHKMSGRNLENRTPKVDLSWLRVTL